ncbi:MULTISPECIES: hypothetical protein [unclassified Halobacteriovorax]|uniref:hypothetical protein n=1 Tax=unclassified Halobacteriovorax TaxID=2639665 RepID=UPI00399BA5F7
MNKIIIGFSLLLTLPSITAQATPVLTFDSLVNPAKVKLVEEKVTNILTTSLERSKVLKENNESDYRDLVEHINMSFNGELKLLLKNKIKTVYERRKNTYTADESLESDVAEFFQEINEIHSEMSELRTKSEGVNGWEKDVENRTHKKIAQLCKSKTSNLCNTLESLIRGRTLHAGNKCISTSLSNCTIDIIKDIARLEDKPVREYDKSKYIPHRSMYLLPISFLSENSYIDSLKEIHRNKTEIKVSHSTFFNNTISYSAEEVSFKLSRNGASRVIFGGQYSKVEDSLGYFYELYSQKETTPNMSASY